MSADLQEVKKRLRVEARQRRAAACAASPEAGAAVGPRLLDALERGEVALATGAPVSAYWPKGDELDPRSAMTALCERGHAIGLPVVVEADTPLVFRAWQPGDQLCPAGFGLLEPAPGQPEVVPELLLVPLLGFDRRGMRLGYGGGFYDRTLALLEAGGAAPLAVGLAYAGQELPEVAAGPTDRRLDWIVTESELIDTREVGHAAAVLR